VGQETASLGTSLINSRGVGVSGMMERTMGRFPPEMKDMRVSAIQLAELAGLRPEDIHYWAHKRYIKRSGNGSKRPFSMRDLHKVCLMRDLTRKYGMDALKASKVADELLQMHADKPDAYVAALGLLEAFDKSLTTLAEVLADVGFIEALAASGLVRSEELAVGGIGAENGNEEKETPT